MTAYILKIVTLLGGQLQESAAFTEQFDRYRARYTFPEEKPEN